ncbi:hypothetical protein [Oscillatoria salina]|uniref:hypothetical protein n=1 Tax=Oscillatoria salina TaxID=331517 RepID=UPI0013B8A339|nr:hypothetical protein [Oscillatoria salina]MBZ8183151.1 hypothetical protein [Oscillatoria salina IIICB1]NET87064.1 hypothetical protein [Kamptonema sp. SIO1D9]
MVLESCIEIVKEKITRKRVVFHGVNFYLSEAYLEQIELARETGAKLNLSRPFLTDWRYYALFDEQNRFQSGLTFSTYYEQGNSNIPLMRSVISLDGDILHQIANDCLSLPDFALKITSAHYWLIEQLLAQLRLEAQNWLNWFSWGLSLIIVAVTVLGNLEKLLPINPITLLAPLLMAWLLQVGIKRLLLLILPHFRRWLLRQLLFGMFSQSPQKRKFVLRLLGRLGI